jgi:hypothetical protein
MVRRESVLLLNILLSAAFWVCFVSVFGLAVTFPAALFAGGFSHFLSRQTGLTCPAHLALGGFAVGALIWLFLIQAAPREVVIFGAWLSAVAIGGPAGAVGGSVFARRMRTRVDR